MDIRRISIRYVIGTSVILLITGLALLRVSESDKRHPQVHEYCMSQSIRDSAHGATAC